MSLLLATTLALQLTLPTLDGDTGAHQPRFDPWFAGGGGGAGPAPYDGATIAVQLGTGAAGAVVVGAPSFILGALLAGDGGHGFAALGGGVVGFVLGAHLGYGLGVWIGGALRGHSGSFLATVGSSVLGLAASVLVGSLGPPVLIAATITATLVGTLWTYHATDAATRGLAVRTEPLARPVARASHEPSAPAAPLFVASF